MKQYPSSAITRRSGEILDEAAIAPVAITKYRKPKYVIMSAEHYARLKGGDTREVYSLETAPEDVRREMLDAIDAELARE